MRAVLRCCGLSPYTTTHSAPAARAASAARPAAATCAALKPVSTGSEVPRATKRTRPCVKVLTASELAAATTAAALVNGDKSHMQRACAAASKPPADSDRLDLVTRSATRLSGISGALTPSGNGASLPPAVASTACQSPLRGADATASPRRAWLSALSCNGKQGGLVERRMP